MAGGAAEMQQHTTVSNYCNGSVPHFTGGSFGVYCRMGTHCSWRHSFRKQRSWIPMQLELQFRNRANLNPGSREVPD